MTNGYTSIGRFRKILDGIILYTQSRQCMLLETCSRPKVMLRDDLLITYTRDNPSSQARYVPHSAIKTVVA